MSRLLNRGPSPVFLLHLRNGRHIMKLKHLQVIFLVIAISGCAGTTQLNNLSPIEPNAMPETKIDVDQTFQLANERTYFLNYKEPVDQPQNSIFKHRVLFTLENMLTLLGYERSLDRATSNISIEVTASGHDNRVIVPPSTTYLPMTMGGGTTTTLVPQSGSFSASPFMGGLGGSITGSYSGYSMIQSANPTYVMNIPIHNPGSTHYSRSTKLEALFHKENTLGLKISSSATFKGGDDSINSQILALMFIKELPYSDRDDMSIKYGKHTIGIMPYIMSSNGNDFYPVVLEIYDQSLEDQGLERLDMIISVNGVETRNKNIKELRPLFYNDNPDPVVCVIKRIDKTITLNLKTKPISELVKDVDSKNKRATH